MFELLANSDFGFGFVLVCFVLFLKSRCLHVSFCLHFLRSFVNSSLRFSRIYTLGKSKKSWLEKTDPVSQVLLFFISVLTA